MQLLGFEEQSHNICFRENRCVHAQVSAIVTFSHQVRVFQPRSRDGKRHICRQVACIVRSSRVEDVCGGEAVRELARGPCDEVMVVAFIGDDEYLHMHATMTALIRVHGLPTSRLTLSEKGWRRSTVLRDIIIRLATGIPPTLASGEPVKEEARKS